MISPHYRSDLTPYIAKFNYSHTLQNGNRVVSRISDAHLGLDTTKTYDQLGRLSYERVDLQKPNEPRGSDRYEERFYEYGAQGRIIFKDARLRLSSNGPGTVPLPTPSTGQQVYVYAGNRTIATVGADRLAGATKFDFAYTPMSEAATSGTSRYVVQSGDTLIDIAQAIYGDGALWYIIADANSIAAAPDDPLDATEVGKAYEIPSVIRSTNSASTFNALRRRGDHRQRPADRHSATAATEVYSESNKSPSPPRRSRFRSERPSSCRIVACQRRERGPSVRV